MTMCDVWMWVSLHSVLLYTGCNALHIEMVLSLKCPILPHSVLNSVHNHNFNTIHTGLRF